MSYSFRIRFTLPPIISIGIDSNVWIVDRSDGFEVVLHSVKKETSIKESRKLVLQGQGYQSEHEANDAGYYYQDILMQAFAKSRIGADFGDRAPKGCITNFGLQYFEQKLGKRVLNDQHGLMTFRTEPPPVFGSTEVNAVLTKSQESLAEAIELALYHKQKISSQERLSFDLYSTSFFQPSADSRFLMLMMSIETLFEPAPRSKLVQEHVEMLIGLTKEATSLSQDEKNSLIGSIQWLLKESIGKAGRRLAKRLGERKYADKNPSEFFTYCYNLRSKLVHGYFPRPTREEVDYTAAILENFIGDLLSGPLLSLID